MNHQSEVNHKQYTKARNKAKSTVIKKRKERERDIAESAKSNCKNFWAYINSKRKAKSGISELHDNRDGITHIASTDQDKAEVLAKFFVSVFTIEDNSDSVTLGNKDCQHPSNAEKFKREEVNKLLNGLNTTKSPGPDQVHPIVLYKLADIIDVPLCYIFSSSFNSGIVPSEWKSGQISAIFKKGDRKSASNYRPVSLTSIICKIMEKLIKQRIVDHMNDNDLLSNRQFGIIGGRSTNYNY